MVACLTYIAGHEAEMEILGKATTDDDNDRRQIDWMLDSFSAPAPVAGGVLCLRAALAAVLPGFSSAAHRSISSGWPLPFSNSRTLKAAKIEKLLAKPAGDPAGRGVTFR